MERFVKFRVDNFLPSHRTPWGGNYLYQNLKAGLDFKRPALWVGESFEFSFDPNYPSYLQASDCSFADYLQDNPHFLSTAHRALWGNASPLLVKYLDARSDLSVQLHPPLDASWLPPGYSGKWEAWHILHAEAGAGIYLGFREDLDPNAFNQAARNGEDLRGFLNFREVKAGEHYLIEPCMPHALGRGVVLLEPQIIRIACEAVTFRLYDWQRRYDADGHESPQGQFRALHTEEALRALAEYRARPSESLLREHYQKSTQNGLLLETFTALPHLKYQLISGSGKLRLPAPRELVSLIIAAGRAQIQVDGQAYRVRAGESGALSAESQNIEIELDEALLFLAHCHPGKVDD